MSRPSTRAAPVVGVSRFSRHLINVLLPAPLGPRRPIVPRGTCSVTSCNARCAPKFFPRPSVSITKAPLSVRADGGAGGEEVAGEFKRFGMGTTPRGEARLHD